jgi:hypothetical protein
MSVTLRPTSQACQRGSPLAPREKIAIALPGLPAASAAEPG